MRLWNINLFLAVHSAWQPFLSSIREKEKKILLRISYVLKQSVVNYVLKKKSENIQWQQMICWHTGLTAGTLSRVAWKQNLNSVAMMHFLSKQKQRKTIVHKALEDCLNYTSFVLSLFQICFLAHRYRWRNSTMMQPTRDSKVGKMCAWT